MGWWGNWWGIAGEGEIGDPVPDYSDAASLEAAVAERAVVHAGLAALIGLRCYADDAPQNPTAPFLVFSVDSADRSFRTFAHRPQLITAQVTIAAFAASALLRVALTAAVVDAFDEWSGTSAAIVVQRAVVLSERSDIYGLDQQGQLFCKTLDIEIVYENPDPVYP